MVMSFKAFINSLAMAEECDCPANHVPLLQLQDSCICIPQSEMKHLRCTIKPDYGRLEPPVLESLVFEKPIEFNLTDSVTARVGEDGIFLQVRDGKWFKIPPAEHKQVLDLINDRLMH